MKKQLTSPCNDCHKWKRFFCLISCKDYDQWNMDQYIRPMFAAPDPVEPFTDLDSRDELVDALIAKISAQDECIRSRDVVLDKYREDLSLYKAAEQYAKQENATLQATLMDRDREIEELTKYRSNSFRNTVMLMAFITEELGLQPEAMPVLLPSGPDEEQTLYDEVQIMYEILDVPIATRCDYCKELHDPRIACPEYAATIDGVKEVE